MRKLKPKDLESHPPKNFEVTIEIALEIIQTLEDCISIAEQGRRGDAIKMKSGKRVAIPASEYGENEGVFVTVLPKTTLTVV